ncbi:Co2+/Mg2+ efflux protein ApaG [Pseudaeromonas paramecii]|uniref:Co2+/Mg2+ efflux protein ApaG n=1 Tax=Pseudaeromonas paramecii TaxID=2138166 RepID=A0ABP8Q9L3_9GAMM
MPSRLQIRATPQYQAELSNADEAHYCFIYHIEIVNQGAERVQLLEREWLITDGDGQQQTVRGPGVVGEQPFIAPGETFDYHSSVTLRTPLGFMTGFYQFQDQQGRLFKAEIPLFTLAVPHLLH